VLKVATSGIGLVSSRTAFLVSLFCTKSAIGLMAPALGPSGCLYIVFLRAWP
jgi:hypothetical protein